MKLLTVLSLFLIVLTTQSCKKTVSDDLQPGRQGLLNKTYQYENTGSGEKMVSYQQYHYKAGDSLPYKVESFFPKNGGFELNNYDSMVYTAGKKLEKIFIHRYNANSGNVELYMRKHFLYNGGRMALEHTYYDSVGVVVVPFTRKEYAYNSQGLLSETKEYLVSSGSLRATVKYEYNTNGTLYKESYIHNSGAQPLDVLVYAYNGGKLANMENFFQGQLTYRVKLSYDAANGNVIERLKSYALPTAREERMTFEYR